MAYLPGSHQSEQGPCGLRGGRGCTLEALIVESITDSILAPAAVLILDRDQPGHGLANRGILVVDLGGVERAQHRPRAVNVVHPPAAIPAPLRKLGPAQIGNARREHLAALRGLAKLGQHRDAAGGNVFGRRIEQRAVIGEWNIVEIIFEIVDVEGGPAAIAALHALDPFAAARDRGIVFMAPGSVPRAIHRHYHNGGVVEVPIVGIFLLEGPATRSNLGPPHYPRAPALHQPPWPRTSPALFGVS